MNIETSINYIWWVAAGGAAGALSHHLAMTLLAPRVGAHRVVMSSTMCACGLLGLIVAAGNYKAEYALVGIGFLGAFAPFTALVALVLPPRGGKPKRRAVVLGIWCVVAGVAMAIFGYILADTGDSLFDKLG